MPIFSFPRMTCLTPASTRRTKAADPCGRALMSVGPARHVFGLTPDASGSSVPSREFKSSSRPRLDPRERRVRLRLRAQYEESWSGGPAPPTRSWMIPIRPKPRLRRPKLHPFEETHTASEFLHTLIELSGDETVEVSLSGSEPSGRSVSRSPAGTELPRLPRPIRPVRAQ
jgi:hypothetical protein